MFYLLLLQILEVIVGLTLLLLEDGTAFGQTKAVLALRDLETLEDGRCGGLRVLRVARNIRDQGVVTLYEPGVDGSVEETETGDMDTLQHT